jgi:malonyl-CoA O-methyltransferase
MTIQDAYNEWSGIYDNNQNLTRDLDMQVTRAVLAGKRFKSILELGCGTGKNTVFFAEIGTHVDALDFSEGMMQKAKEKISANHVQFRTADLTQRWPCEDDRYDLISVNLVLEFIHSAGHAGLALESFNEHWHAEDVGKPPRLASFVFRKNNY